MFGEIAVRCSDMIVEFFYFLDGLVYLTGICTWGYLAYRLIKGR